MFTGLVEEVGKVASLRKTPSGARLTVESNLEGVSVGESISVNGACQTVTVAGKGAFTCEVLRETLRVTNLGRLKPGAPVNLERAARADARLGGHIVNGHIDGIGRVTRISRRPIALDVSVTNDLFRYIVPKGSVALNGVSLTIGPDPRSGTFSVFIIGYTWRNTNLSSLRVGDEVNIEIDILAKYIEASMQKGRGENS
jgi:riboflavin synthase